MIEFLLEYDTAGDPITGLKWSRRTTEKIALALGDFGIIVSPNTVARLLHQMGYSLRVNHKQLSTDGSPDRNDQFLYLGDLRQHFQRRGLPIISVDTKKRELPEDLWRNAGFSARRKPSWRSSERAPCARQHARSLKRPLGPTGYSIGCSPGRCHAKCPSGTGRLRT